MAELNEAAFLYSSVNTTFVGGGLNDVLTTSAIAVPYRNHRMFIFGWAQITHGTITDNVTPQILRILGSTTVVVTPSASEQVKTAASQTEPYFVAGVENTRDLAGVFYRLRLSSGAAANNGTVLQSCMIVLAL